MFEKDFDKEFNKGKKLAITVAVIYGTIVISIIVFIGWVIIKIMQHFGVI